MTQGSAGALRRFIIVCREQQAALEAEEQLLTRGRGIACQGCVTPGQHKVFERAIQPEVILAETGVELDTTLRVIRFDPARFDPLEVVSQLLTDLAPAVPETKPAPCLTWRVALGFAGMAGGVGTTSLVCAFALAAARRGENVLLVDMAGGDCLPTLGGDLRRETAAWSVRKKEFGDGLTVIVADSLNHIERQPDALLIDLGAMTNRARIDAVTRAGVKVFYVLPHALDMAGVSHPAPERRLVTLAPRPSGADFPFEPELVRRINAKTFEPADTAFMQACDAWLAGQLYT